MSEHPQTFEQARAAEELNALLAHLPYARPLLGRLVVPLRWAHELELTLSGNAFFIGKAPLRGDFFELLWRLDPCFVTADGRFPNLPPGARRPSRLTLFRLRAALWRQCLTLDIHAAEPLVRQWLATHWQDCPRPEAADPAAEVAPVSRLQERVNQFDGIVLHFRTSSSYRPDECLQLGIAWTWQQLRAADLASGDPKRAARWRRPSAALIRFEDEAPAAGAGEGNA